MSILELRKGDRAPKIIQTQTPITSLTEQSDEISPLSPLKWLKTLYRLLFASFIKQLNFKMS
jgi:hypothetical protein